jgi:hypothetical protein
VQEGKTKIFVLEIENLSQPSGKLMHKAEYAVVITAFVSDRVEFQPKILVRRFSDAGSFHLSMF